MAADPLFSEVFPVEPGISVPEADQHALTKAIRNAMLPKNLKKTDPRAKNPFAPNMFSRDLLAMQMSPRPAANVCSIPLIEVPVSSDSGAVIGRVAPQEEFDAMPKAEMPAPPCQNWNSHRK
jgi:hypothetical protein